MAIDVSEVDFERDAIERSRQVPVVVDFWGRVVRTLPHADARARGGARWRSRLAKVDVDSNQALRARYGPHRPKARTELPLRHSKRLIAARPLRPRCTLLEQLAEADENIREQLRRAIVGVLASLNPGDSTAMRHRRRLATALYQPTLPSADFVVVDPYAPRRTKSVWRW